MIQLYHQDDEESMTSEEHKEFLPAPVKTSVVALIFSVILPIVGFFVGLSALAKYRRPDTYQNGRFVAIMATIVGFVLTFVYVFAGVTLVNNMSQIDNLNSCKNGKIVDGACVYSVEEPIKNNEGIEIIPNTPAEGEIFGEGYANQEAAISFITDAVANATNNIQKNGGKVIYSTTTDGVNTDLLYYFDPNQSKDIFSVDSKAKVTPNAFDDTLDLFALKLTDKYKVESAEYYNDCLTLHFTGENGFYAMFYDAENKLQTISLSVPSADGESGTTITITPQYGLTEEITAFVGKQLK